MTLKAVKWVFFALVGIAVYFGLYNLTKHGPFQEMVVSKITPGQTISSTFRVPDAKAFAVFLRVVAPADPAASSLRITWRVEDVSSSHQFFTWTNEFRSLRSGTNRYWLTGPWNAVAFDDLLSNAASVRLTAEVIASSNVVPIDLGLTADRLD